jgi:AraC family transcriptional activator of mtrCDE
MRIDEARRMLENNPELTIENIAEDCGFIQLRTFYRNFKERYQMSPAQYRKIAQG